jgi:hypothetical protein
MSYTAGIEFTPIPIKEIKDMNATKILKEDLKRITFHTSC